MKLSWITFSLRLSFLLSGFSKQCRLEFFSNDWGILLNFRGKVAPRLLTEDKIHHLSKGLDLYLDHYDNLLVFRDRNCETSQQCLDGFCNGITFLTE